LLAAVPQFTDRYPPGSLTDDPSAVGEFEPDLRALMETYEAAPPPDALKQAQTDLGNVKDIMVRFGCAFGRLLRASPSG
jgi:hypothetical protein